MQCLKKRDVARKKSIEFEYLLLVKFLEIYAVKNASIHQNPGLSYLLTDRPKIVTVESNEYLS